MAFIPNNFTKLRKKRNETSLPSIIWRGRGGGEERKRMCYKYPAILSDKTYLASDMSVWPSQNSVGLPVLPYPQGREMMCTSTDHLWSLPGQCILGVNILSLIPPISGSLRTCAWPQRLGYFWRVISCSQKPRISPPPWAELDNNRQSSLIPTANRDRAFGKRICAI